MFAEGSLPERHTLVLEKRAILVRCSPKASPWSVTPRFEAYLTWGITGFLTYQILAYLLFR